MRTVNARRTVSGTRATTVAGLVGGCPRDRDPVGIGSRVPDISAPGDRHPVGRRLVRLAGTLAVRTRRGSVLGLFVFVGFLISPTGLSNLFGEAGTSIAIGQGVQVIGVLTAMIAGVIATRANYRKQAQASQ